MENNKLSLLSRPTKVSFFILSCLFFISFQSFAHDNDVAKKNEMHENILSTASNFANNEITQQRRQIKGNVTDIAGNPLPGVTVIIKGTEQGIATDIDGSYTLNNVSNETVLVFSFIGMKTIEEPVGNRSVIDVVLEEESIGLQEVVAVGFGTQKKINVTGSVSMVNSDVIENRPITNVSQALQGQIPGLHFNVGDGGGDLKSNMEVNIRGWGTIGEGSISSPLILIDGVEGNMNTINPNDIESVSVLKDAASSAIYGSRAAFGVILITTKQGKIGKPSVNYSGNVRFSNPTRLPNVMDSYTYAQFLNRASVNNGYTPVFSNEILQRIQDYQNGVSNEETFIDPNSNVWTGYELGSANTDWFEEYYRSWVPSHEHNVSVNGGNEKIKYYLSGNFLNQHGLLRHGEDIMNRYTINAKVSVALSQYIDLSYGTKWLRSVQDHPTFQSSLLYHNIARSWPTTPVKDPNGYYTAWSNILQLRDGGRRKDALDESYHHLQLVAKPLEGWRIVADGNIRLASKDIDFAYLPIYGHDGDGNPYGVSWMDGVPAGFTRVQRGYYKDEFMTTNLYSDYEKNIDGHYFKLLGGFNAEIMKSEGATIRAEGLITPTVPHIGATTQNQYLNASDSEWAVAGFFGRANYNYEDRYMAEFNIRRDGSSRFVRDRRWGTFPSISLGWNIAKEEFWSDWTDYVNMLKFRTSWGELGNMNTSSWYPFHLTMPIYMLGGDWLLNSNARPNTSYAPGLVSSLMTWETVRSWDIAMDWGAFNNRFTGSFGYYIRKTLDMIGPAPSLPNILGTSVPKINNADEETKGWELELAWKDRIGDFTYGAKLLLEDQKRVITSYPQSGLLYEWYVGKNVGEIWGFETVGIAKTNEEMQAHLATTDQSAAGGSWGAGDIMYKDLNGDGVLGLGSYTLDDHGDLKLLGNSTPRYRFGFTLDAAWKGIDISMFFQGVGKRDLALDDVYFWGTGGLWGSVGFEEHWDFFRPEDDPLGANLDGYYPKPYVNSEKNKLTQSGYLQDGSYIRLKNMQVGYTIPTNIVKKAGVQYLRVYMSGENLWTRSSLSGMYDPEGVSGEYGTGKVYPLQKVISFGVNVNF